MSMMSSIGMSGAAMMSPRAMMDKRIDSAVQAGSISATDQTAMETALDAIDSALGVGSSSSSASGSAATSKLDPSQMGSRIDDLIGQQVKAGKLTDAQASALQSLFAQNAPPQGGPDGASGDTTTTNGVEGAGKCAGGGRPMGPPPSKSGSSDSDSDASSTSTDATDATRQLDALITFLQNMREKMTTQTGYSASGTATSASANSTSGLIVDSLA